jgi:regulator of sirC expression with transglutaminase-like and TPR domain
MAGLVHAHSINPTTADPLVKAHWVSQALFGRLGLQVGTSRARQTVEDHPDRYFIDKVIEKRRGSPLSLAILYLCVAQKISFSCECVALSGRFLVRFKDQDSEHVVDPFEGGRVLTHTELQRRFKHALQTSPLVCSSVFERLSFRHIAGRLIQQIKQLYMLQGNAVCALRAVELLAVLFPGLPEHARDRGILYCEIECFSKAATDLNHYLRLRPEADDVREIKKLTSMLKG